MKRNRFYFWTMFFNPVLLVVFILAMYFLTKFARYGGLKTRGLLAFLLLGLCGIWFIVWTVIYHKKDKTKTELSGKWKMFMLFSVLVFGAAVIISVYQMCNISKDFTTKLGYYLYEQENTKAFKLKKDNIIENHFSEIWEEISDKLDMPENLYISDSFQIDCTKNGTIIYIYGFVYGKDEKGNLRTYLVDYDKNKSSKVQVWIDNTLSPTYKKNLLLYPMTAILDKLDFKEITKDNPGDKFELLYCGKRNIENNAGENYLVDQDGNIKKTELSAGYEISCYVPTSEFKKEELISRENDKYIKRYFADFDVLSHLENLPEEVTEKNSEASSKEEKNKIVGENVTDSDTGDVYYYLDEQTGYCMQIVDAAAGSRFFQLLKTENGGDTWEVLNEDPCLGNCGANPTMDFENEENGTITLPNASGTEAMSFKTSDGGLSFSELTNN